MQIGPSFGLKCQSVQGDEIPLESLSSGEKHEVVLAHHLLFKTGPGWLVMIDEPEISLHVGWQREYLNDLKKIQEITGGQFLVATHSPAIVGDYWDWVVPLGDDVSEEEE